MKSKIHSQIIKQFVDKCFSKHLFVKPKLDEEGAGLIL